MNQDINITPKHKRKQRPDIKTLSLGELAYQAAKKLAFSEGRSVSSYLRELIKKAYSENKHKFIDSDVKSHY